MTPNSPSNHKRVPTPPTGAIRNHWILFLVEGMALIVLGLIAIAVPSITSANTTFVLGWIFVVSGAVGLVTTYWAQQAPGHWWSLVSALLAIFVGVVLTTNKSQDLYGTLMVWPFEDASPLQLILIVFFLVEGGASIMFAIEHRRRSSGRWAWILASGITDIVLASIVLASIISFNLAGASAWTGLLVGINMMLGGFALFAMGSHARSERTSSNAVPPRDL
jgi:uncharacterized membrane protein HdeD (DUF308 family)